MVVPKKPRKRPGATSSQPLTLQAVRVDLTASGFGMTDEEIERSLVSGENAGLLEDYFGPAQFDELRRLARESESRGARSGDRILILPGIMGSTLGYSGGLLTSDMIWLDPVDIALGRLSELAIRPGQRPIVPTGVIVFTYMSLKLRLRLAGFDAEFMPYDWRLSVAELGTALANTVNGSDRKVQIIAHSMGGLVARAALGSVGANLTRIVMLGTPNGGSFSPVQAFRGVGDVVSGLDLLDRVHDAGQLADIFGEFPGLIEMVPAAGIASSDLFDLASWPATGHRPAPQALQHARAVQAGLAKAKPGVDIVLIAGIDQETVVDAHLSNGEFAYAYSTDGDGTVPLKSAQRVDANAVYFVACKHGSLPGNLLIQRALPDILAGGRTTVLETQRSRGGGVTRTVRESALRPPPQAASKSLPSLREQRLLLAPFAAPADPASEAPIAAAGAPGFQDAYSDMIVVGRGRQHRIEITMAHGSITDADAAMYVVGLFKNVEPGGAAQVIDAIMGGAVTDLVARRMFSADVGEISIIPSGRHPLRADGLAFVGLGPFDGFKPDVLEVVGENLIRSFVASRIDDFAVVPIGTNSGEEMASVIRHLVAGFLRGLKDADRDQRFRGITICEIDPQRFELIRNALYHLSTTTLFEDVEVTFRERQLPPSSPLPAVRSPARPDPKIYLIVREEAERDSTRTGLMSSLLTSDANAAISSGHQPIDLASGDGLGALLDKLEDVSEMTKVELDQFGTSLGELVLASTVRQSLAQHLDRHLVIVHDAAASRIPWETLRIDGTAPALAAGISHRYEAADLSVAKFLQHRREDRQIKMLLVIDPTENLAGARQEGENILALCKALGPAVDVTVLKGREARKAQLIALFSSGAFDVLHYAGHAFFDPQQRTRSGLLCADGEVLSGGDLAAVSNLPTLMFFNACEAARVRGERPSADSSTNPSRSDPSPSEVVARGIGFAEALLRGGVANFVGTYWPVGDASAAAFAASFYRQLLEGASLGDALHEGRSTVEALPSSDWADYVFYGDTDFRLKPSNAPSEVSKSSSDKVGGAMGTARLTLRYGPGTAEIVRCVPIDGPPPAGLLAIEADSTGGWIEVADAAGIVVYRHALADPFSGLELHSDAGQLKRGRRGQEPRLISLEIPWPGDGSRATVHARAPDTRKVRARSRGGSRETIARAAAPPSAIASFDLAPAALPVARGALPPIVRRPVWGFQNPKAFTLAFFAEGFRADEMNGFRAMVDHCIDAFAATAPYSRLLPNLAVAAVETPSNASGIGAVAGDTAFHGHFQSGELSRVILIDQGIAAKWLDRCFKTPATALIIANSPVYGGAGGLAPVFSCERNSATEIAIHELGHSLFGLADEYEAAGQAKTMAPVELNVSGTAERGKLKWARLVAPATPLPTQPHGAPPPPGLPIGAYEGGKYRSRKIWRPAHDCKMRALGVPFCQVCEQAIVDRLSQYHP